ncbi:Putative agmatine deiminase [Roseovarius albus]|uniref:Putative agmatine deiminase n=1 Tax=Roseovarius albus TaxID=1247867 RepID=A0A1X6ZCI3_9RHOB|nr:agmatine deiminase family protein [Roseovarius albus]SLN47590.1 Putative agmatine deiminase [Roseovarius albus]
MNRRSLLAGGTTVAAFSWLGIQTEAQSPTSLWVPPEEFPHALTFMQWPASKVIHPDPVFLDMLRGSIADIANAIAEFEPVIMLAERSLHKQANKYLSSKVQLWDIPTEDLWCRDSGPLFAQKDDGTLAVSHIQFNGWGRKQIHQRDGQIAAAIADRLSLELIPSGLQGESGGVEHDGHGLLMAHESSWVNPNRNLNKTREEVEEKLLRAYGAERMIWSAGVWDEDITDYHIDSLARFTGPGRVLINMPDRPDMRDPFHVAALETHDQLVAQGLDVTVIPEPNQRRVKSIDFVASYANYYACNGAIIATEFGDPETDAIAVDALKAHYPGREIVTLFVDPLGEIGGGIHCATQQLPAV